jgi:hypothetical protein
MERKAYWYSIIQYCPNQIRGEKVNVGVLLHDPQGGDLQHSLLEENSTKVKALLCDDVSSKIYKVQKDEVDFYFSKIYEKQDLFSENLHDKNYLINLKHKFPNEFLISEPTFSLSRDANQLFASLVKTYIGEFITKEIIHEYEKSIISPKNYCKNYFHDKNWIGTKVKPNVKLHPIEDLKNLNFTVDFVFKNGIWNMINATPSNTTNDKLIEWFSKTKTMLNSYQRESQFYLIYNQEDQLNEDNTLSEMVAYLEKEDQRVKTAEISSSDFSGMCRRVENEAKDISLFEHELIAM